MTIIHRQSERVVCFRCPGCGNIHCLPVAGDKGPLWLWNGSLDRPTFDPSILARSGHYAPGWKYGSACWCSYNDKHPDDGDPFKCGICHSFVRDGNIQFLVDSTHELAGKTVPIPEWDHE